MARLQRSYATLMLLAAAVSGAGLISCGDSHPSGTSPTASTAPEAPAGADGASSAGPSPSDPSGATDAAESEGQGTVRLNVSFADWRPDAAKPAELQVIDQATVYVYAPDGAEMARQQLTLVGGRATGELIVRAAENLRVVIVFYDGEVVRYLGQDSDVDVEIGQETTADLLCHYMGTWVQTPEIAGVDRSYTVSWAARTHATGYELQEATDPDFAEPTHLYEGTGLYYEVAGKAEVGAVYYYRGRAGTGYGLGPWHSTGAAAVEIHRNEGRIRIDIPIPPDEPDEPPPPMVVVPDTSAATIAVTLDFQGPTGLTWRDGHLLVLLAFTSILVEVDPQAGSEVARYTLPIPDMLHSDLAWDGEHIWAAPYSGPVSKIRASDLAVVSQYALYAHGRPYMPRGGGLTFDGSSVWVQGRREDDGGAWRGVFRLGPGSQEFELHSEVETSENPATFGIDPGGFLWGDGFGWDGRYFWTVNGHGLRKYDPQGYLVAFLEASYPTNVEGCAYGNGLVWYSDYPNNIICGVEP